MKKILFAFLLAASILQSCKSHKSKPVIVMETDLGNIEFVLYADKAPITTTNFLRYINELRLDSATFYRTVRADNQANSPIKIAVIQGGLYEDEHPLMLPPITHENTEQTGIKHLDGVLSMARNQPGTATSEFFICVGNQPSLDYGGMRNSDGQGFAAFGQVTKGMDVVHKIHQAPTEGQYLKPRIKINRIYLK